MNSWRLRLIIVLLGLTTGLAFGQNVTLVGQLQASNGLPSSNFSISFVPSQWGFIAGTGVVVNQTTYCATSTDGSVVGIVNPLTASIVTPAFTGTLPAGNYYVQYTWYTAGGTETLASPESVANLSGTGELSIPPPPGPIPAGVVGMKVYVGDTSGSETYQGLTVGTAPYVQSVPLVTGAALPTSNNTVCIQVANDAIWPVGTGYQVSIADPSGNTLPGYPMLWQLLGPNTTINLSNGLPYYHGVVTFPVPILSAPLNHAMQSISGPLSLTGYNLVNVGKLGVGTGLPAWGIDVEGAGLAGIINAKGGYLINGAGGTNNQVPCSDGTAIDHFCTVPVGTLYYQKVINGSHDSDAVGQEIYLQVGAGTGIIATDHIGVGSQVSRTALNLDTIGGTSTLSSDPHPVVTASGGILNQFACWDGTGGGLAASSVPCNGGTTFVDLYSTVDGCNVAGSTDNQCAGAFNLPGSMSDANYQVFTQLNNLGGTQNLLLTITTSPLPAGLTPVINYVLTCTFGCTGAVSPKIYVHAHHN